MNVMEMQVNRKKIYIHITDDAYDALEYMRDFKQLKQRVRVAVINNEQNDMHDGICRMYFISSHLGNPTYLLRRMASNIFMVERVED